MSIVRINAITVPEGGGAELQGRFEQRVGEVELKEGFEGFELLRPDDGDTWYVYTRWRSVEDFEAWVHSDAFARGHAHADRAPVAATAHLISFDVVLEAAPSQHQESMQ